MTTRRGPVPLLAALLVGALAVLVGGAAGAPAADAATRSGAVVVYDDPVTLGWAPLGGTYRTSTMGHLRASLRLSYDSGGRPQASVTASPRYATWDVVSSPDTGCTSFRTRSTGVPFAQCWVELRWNYGGYVSLDLANAPRQGLAATSTSDDFRTDAEITWYYEIELTPSGYRVNRPAVGWQSYSATSTTGSTTHYANKVTYRPGDVQERLPGSWVYESTSGGQRLTVATGGTASTSPGDCGRHRWNLEGIIAYSYSEYAATARNRCVPAQTERAVVFRYATYLQLTIGSDIYFLDRA